MPSISVNAADRMAAATLVVERRLQGARNDRGRWTGDGVPPWKFVKLTEALAYGSSADAVVRVRNSADTAYEDSTTHEEIYPPDFMASGDPDVPTGTICKVEFLCDPLHPHWIATEWPCVTT
jgi:hypothetical protein